MRVERFTAQRNDGVRKTLTLHLLLFLCKQQQQHYSGQTERAFTFGLLYSVIYLRSDLGAVVRLLLESAAYRLVWMRAWLSVAGLSPSPSDVSKLWSSGEPSLKKSRLRERTVNPEKRAEIDSKTIAVSLVVLSFNNSFSWFPLPPDIFTLTGPEDAAFFLSFNQTGHFIPGPLLQENLLNVNV